MKYSQRLSFVLTTLIVGLGLGCNPVTNRPPFNALPQAVRLELELPMGIAMQVLADALRGDSIPIDRVEAIDGYVEGPWFRADDGTVTGNRPVGPDIVKVRGWAIPGRPGHIDIELEAVYRPVADPSRPGRDLEVILPPGHPVASRIETVVRKLITRYGDPAQLPPPPPTPPDTIRGGR